MRGFKRVHGTLFSLSFGSIPDRAHPGAACVVSAKTAPRATTRNRIKRLCRTALSPLVSGLVAPAVVVCIAKKPAADASLADVRRELAALMRAAGLHSGV